MHTDYESYSSEDFLMDDSFICYCSGTDASVNEAWEQWCRQHPEKLADINTAKELYKALHGTLPAEEITNERNNLQELFEKRYGPKTQLQTMSRFRYLKQVKVAAAVLVLLAAGIWLFTKSGDVDFKKQQTLQAKLKSNEYVNNQPEKKQIVLPDGTEVILNGYTALRLADDFGVTERSLELTQGTAYFKVAHDETRPFRVKSNDLITTALGTEFLVQTNPDKIQISLMEGSVKVQETEEDESKVLILKPGNRAEKGTKSSTLAKSDFDLEEVKDWQANILRFHNADFDELISRLSQYYGVVIHINGENPPEKHYTAIFNNKSLQVVLDAIGYSQNFTYNINGQLVEIDLQKL